MIFCDPIFLITKIYVSPLAYCLSASSFHEQRTSCITQTLKHLQCLLGLALQLGAWRGWFPRDCLPELVNNMPNHNSGTVTFWPTRQRAIHHEHEHEHMCTLLSWLQCLTVPSDCKDSQTFMFVIIVIIRLSAIFARAQSRRHLLTSVKLVFWRLCHEACPSAAGIRELVSNWFRYTWTNCAKKDKERHPVPLTWEICVG